MAVKTFGQSTQSDSYNSIQTEIAVEAGSVSITQTGALNVNLSLQPAGNLTAYTVVLPGEPFEGQKVSIGINGFDITGVTIGGNTIALAGWSSVNFIWDGAAWNPC